jgi:hypothetical protein
VNNGIQAGRHCRLAQQWLCATVAEMCKAIYETLYEEAVAERNAFPALWHDVPM